MNAVAGLTSSHNSASRLVAAGATDAPPGEVTARDAFRDFVAGTFYQQMLKSLHATHGKPAYFHGGQAEEMFQSQLDQQVAQDMAKTHGAPFADRLFEAFSRQMKAKNIAAAGADVASAYAGDQVESSQSAISKQV